MPNHTVRFFFDFASPYSYFASEFVEEVCAKHNATLIWEPMVLGALFQEDQTTPMHAIPKRSKYLKADLVQTSEALGIPYQPRTEFLIKAITPMRVVLQLEQGESRTRAVHAIFRAAWAQDQDISNAEVLGKILHEAGFDPIPLLEGTQQEGIKNQLKSNTEEAITLGIFGAPTMVLDGGKMFWGHDRLKTLDYFLGKAEQ